MLLFLIRKKNMTGHFSLEKSNNKSQLNYLVGLDNEIVEDKKILIKKIDNKIINELFY